VRVHTKPAVQLGTTFKADGMHCVCHIASPCVRCCRFFYGRLAPKGGWSEALAQQFRQDFGDCL
jgi:hypothetical protein